MAATIHNKVCFISVVMDQLGYFAKEVTRAEDSDGIVYWLDGLTGFYNPKTKDTISFGYAQSIAATFLRLLKKLEDRHKHYTLRAITMRTRHVDIKPTLSYYEIADIIGEAIYCSTPHLLVGDFKGMVYCNRKKLIKDEASGTLLFIKGKH